MTKLSPKNIIISLIIVAAIAGATWYGFKNTPPEMGTTPTITPSPSSTQLAASMTPFPSYSPPSPEEYWKSPKTYENKKYGFSFQYHPVLVILDETPECIVLGDEGGPWQIGVDVEIATVSSVDEWLAVENERGLSPKVIEKRITVDGYPAIITYQEQPGEIMAESPGHKTTVFIKDKHLYKISTNYVTAPERLWESFKFTD
jgi:hypothetical protein